MYCDTTVVVRFRFTDIADKPAHIKELVSKVESELKLQFGTTLQSVTLNGSL